MPDGIVVCIHDFGVVHYAGHAVRMRNIFGGVEVVHSVVAAFTAASKVENLSTQTMPTLGTAIRK